MRLNAITGTDERHRSRDPIRVRIAFGSYPRQRAAVRALIQRLGWPVYADLASGLRLAEVGTHIIRYFDQALLSDGMNQETRRSLPCINKAHELSTANG